MIVVDKAIIIKTMKYGESSRILTMFTKNKGIVRFLAKGARSSKNRASMCVDLLSIVELTYYQKKNSELQLLSKAERVQDSSKIVNSLECLNVALLIAESLLLTVPENMAHEEIFNFTEKCLVALNENPPNPFNIFAKHQIELTADLGFAPDFSEYSKYNTGFSVDLGSFAGESSKFGRNVYNFDEELAIYLQFISSEPDIANILLYLTDAELIKRIIDFFIRYFSYHLEKNIYYTTYKLLK
jgi:DNA repair protein RecO